jgi:putative FmdB family regulatory protein
MPLYEYLCSDCGDAVEVIQKFSDEPLQTCPDCGGQMERLLSAPAIRFKGTGWYVTDYAGKNGGKSEGDSESKTEKKSDAKGDSSKDSKTAPTAKS